MNWMYGEERPGPDLHAHCFPGLSNPGDFLGVHRFIILEIHTSDDFEMHEQRGLAKLLIIDYAAVQL